MDGAFLEKQTTEAFDLNDREFEHNYRVDVTDPAKFSILIVGSLSTPLILLMLCTSSRSGWLWSVGADYEA